MPEVRRYECMMQCEGYRIGVNVFSDNATDVPALARMKAASLIKRLYRLPVEHTEITVISCIDRGTVPDHEPDVMEQRQFTA